VEDDLTVRVGDGEPNVSPIRSAGLLVLHPGLAQGTFVSLLG
jgi:hypothetical protein